MNITAAKIKSLREETGRSMVECKNALVESNGDFEAAKTRLRNSDDQDPEEPDLVE